jgi:preprotein translocase subunit SecA
MCQTDEMKRNRPRGRSHRLSRWRGIDIETDLRPYRKILDDIKKYDWRRANEADLLARARAIKQSAPEEPDVFRLLPETFALAAEIAARRLGLRPFDEQLIAGIVLARGKLAELATGEGKTLAAVFPAALHALGGKGVHVLTANDYLARRDALWMEPVYRAFGLAVAFVGEKTTAAEKRTAYRADVTYLTAKQAGFDYLRDALAFDRNDALHREFHFAIVDEADFILIDEARVPLVLAAESDEPETDPRRIDAAVPRLQAGADFIVDRERRSLHLTLKGEKRVRELLGVGGMHDERYRQTYAAVYVALQAHHLLARDVDYVVRRGRLELIDELTGRVARDRRWPYGIHAALEVKEGLRVRRAGRIFGSIIIQHFLNLYPLRAAMTATAVPAALELSRFYQLATVVLPPHRPVLRCDEPDEVFLTRAAKRAALIAAVEREHRTGRPILVGTRSVKESEELARSLRRRGLACHVLNAKNDRKEAAVIGLAGTLGAITISTNMAGRGTDIKLGGEEGRQREKIKRLGGLLVIGTNRHESVRIDCQLRGRAGRQGDPGASRFFVSLEDGLFLRFGIREFLPKKALEKAQADPESPLADQRAAREIARAQSIIENQNYVIRRTLRRYSLLVEQQRRVVRDLRRAALEAGELPEALNAAVAAGLQAVARRVGEREARRLFIRLFLKTLDRFWADHLADVEDLREGIALQRYGGREPLHEYIRLAAETFERGLERAVTDCAREYRALGRSGRELDRRFREARAPSSTWTYALDDEPLPAFNLALIAGGFTPAVFVALAASILRGAMRLAEIVRKKLMRIDKSTAPD